MDIGILEQMTICDQSKVDLRNQRVKEVMIKTEDGKITDCQFHTLLIEDSIITGKQVVTQNLIVRRSRLFGKFSAAHVILEDSKVEHVEHVELIHSVNSEINKQKIKLGFWCESELKYMPEEALFPDLTLDGLKVKYQGKPVAEILQITELSPDIPYHWSVRLSKSLRKEIAEKTVLEFNNVPSNSLDFVNDQLQDKEIIVKYRWFANAGFAGRLEKLQADVLDVTGLTGFIKVIICRKLIGDWSRELSSQIIQADQLEIKNVKAKRFIATGDSSLLHLPYVTMITDNSGKIVKINRIIKLYISWGIVKWISTEPFVKITQEEFPDIPVQKCIFRKKCVQDQFPNQDGDLFCVDNEGHILAHFIIRRMDIWFLVFFLLLIFLSILHNNFVNR